MGKTCLHDSERDGSCGYGPSWQIGQGGDIEPRSSELGSITRGQHGPCPGLTGKPVLTLLEVHSSRLGITKDSQHPIVIDKVQRAKTCKSSVYHRKKEGGMNIKYSTALNKLQLNYKKQLNSILCKDLMPGLCCYCSTIVVLFPSHLCVRMPSFLRS